MHSVMASTSRKRLHKEKYLVRVRIPCGLFGRTRYISNAQISSKTRCHSPWYLKCQITYIYFLRVESARTPVVGWLVWSGSRLFRLFFICWSRTWSVVISPMYDVSVNVVARERTLQYVTAIMDGRSRVCVCVSLALLLKRLSVSPRRCHTTGPSSPTGHYVW